MGTQLRTEGTKDGDEGVENDAGDREREEVEQLVARFLLDQLGVVSRALPPPQLTPLLRHLGALDAWLAPHHETSPPAQDTPTDRGGVEAVARGAGEGDDVAAAGRVAAVVAAEKVVAEGAWVDESGATAGEMKGGVRQATELWLAAAETAQTAAQKTASAESASTAPATAAVALAAAPTIVVAAGSTASEAESAVRMDPAETKAAAVIECLGAAKEAGDQVKAEKMEGMSGRAPAEAAKTEEQDEAMRAGARLAWMVASGAAGLGSYADARGADEQAEADEEAVTTVGSVKTAVVVTADEKAIETAAAVARLCSAAAPAAQAPVDSTRAQCAAGEIAKDDEEEDFDVEIDRDTPRSAPATMTIECVAGRAAVAVGPVEVCDRLAPEFSAEIHGDSLHPPAASAMASGAEAGGEVGVADEGDFDVVLDLDTPRCPSVPTTLPGKAAEAAAAAADDVHLDVAASAVDVVMMVVDQEDLVVGLDTDTPKPRTKVVTAASATVEAAATAEVCGAEAGRGVGATKDTEVGWMIGVADSKSAWVAGAAVVAAASGGDDGDFDVVIDGDTPRSGAPAAAAAVEEVDFDVVIDGDTPRGDAGAHVALRFAAQDAATASNMTTQDEVVAAGVFQAAT